MHESVLLKEAVDALGVQKGEKYIDATCGTGGHTEEILARGGRALGIEADPKMLKIAEERLNEACPVVLGNFRDIGKIAREHGFEEVAGVLFDLGVSSIHFDEDGRGFSFRSPDAPLDMRLNPKVQGVTAADLLNSLPESHLARLFESRSLASKIVRVRKLSKFEKVADLLEVVGQDKRGKIHPATKAFMSLRIAVNSEYQNLEEALPQAFELLKKGGRLVVISFHSGEDRIVKRFMKDSRVILPTKEEVGRNPRARSAKMRVLAKLEK